MKGQSSRAKLKKHEHTRDKCHRPVRSTGRIFPLHVETRAVRSTTREAVSSILSVSRLRASRGGVKFPPATSRRRARDVAFRPLFALCATGSCDTPGKKRQGSRDKDCR